MSVYVDNARMDVPGVGGICCHMVSDSVKELVATALNMGIGRRALRTKDVALPCFFLSQSKRRYALERGHVVPCSPGKMLELIHAHRSKTASEDGTDEAGSQADGLDDAAGDDGGAGADSVPPAAVKRTPPPPDSRLTKIGPGTRCAAMNLTAGPTPRCRMSSVATFKGLPFCEHHLRQAVRGTVVTSGKAKPEPELPAQEEEKPWPPPLNQDPPYPDRPSPPAPPNPESNLGISCPPEWVKNPQGPVAFSAAPSMAEMRAADRWARIDKQILTVPCRLVTNAQDVRPFHQLHVDELVSR